MYGNDAISVIENLVSIYKSAISNATYVSKTETEIQDEIVTLVSDAIDELF